MLEFKKEYFQTETNRHLYPTTLDISKCEVYGCKDREAFVYKIPNERYTSNAGNIDFSLYPNGVWSDYTAIKIVEKLPYFQPSVNFNKLGDITPSNLNKLKDEIKKHIVDIETAITESYIFIDSGVPGQNNIPYLPNDCVWFKNGATGNIEALPIGELYDRFQNMINTLYKEIKDLLLVDKENMSQELRNETDELLEELNSLDTTIRNEIEKLGNKKIDEIIAEGKKQLELVQGAGTGLAPRVDELEKNKFDKGEVSTDYNSAEKMEGKIKDIIDNKWRLYPKEILNGTDLNNLTELGYYFNWSDGYNIKNAPETMKAFTLKVDSTSPSDPNYVHQTYKEVYSGEVYIRTRVNGNWNAWVRQATTPEVQAVENKLNNLKIKTAVLDVSKWCKLATVYMPRGDSSVYINLATVNGYNGETSQCFPVQIILRSNSGVEIGSENGDIGIGVIQYFKSQVWVKSVGYVKNGDYYDVYIKTGNTLFEMYPYASKVAAFAIYSTEFEFKGDVFDNQPSNLVSEATKPDAISINHIPTISGGVLQGSQTDVILGFGKVYNPVWG